MTYWIFWLFWKKKSIQRCVQDFFHQGQIQLLCPTARHASESINCIHQTKSEAKYIFVYINISDILGSLYLVGPSTKYLNLELIIAENDVKVLVALNCLNTLLNTKGTILRANSWECWVNLSNKDFAEFLLFCWRIFVSNLILEVLIYRPHYLFNPETFVHLPFIET